MIPTLTDVLSAIALPLVEGGSAGVLVSGLLSGLQGPRGAFVFGRRTLDASLLGTVAWWPLFLLGSLATGSNRAFDAFYALPVAGCMVMLPAMILAVFVGSPRRKLINLMLCIQAYVWLTVVLRVVVVFRVLGILGLSMS